MNRRWLPLKEGAQIRVVEPFEPFVGFDVPVSAGLLQCGPGPGDVWCPVCEIKWQRLQRLLPERHASFAGLDVGRFVQ